MNTNPLNFKSQLLAALGGPWPTACPLQLTWLSSVDCKGYTRHKISYYVASEESVHAFILQPHHPIASPGPAIAVWHQHNGEHAIGKSEPAGLAGNPMHFTGEALAQRGYTVFCPDSIGFEDRQHDRLKGFDYEYHLFSSYLLQGKSLLWKNILDMKRAIDCLAAIDWVDASRIGCYGHSLGATQSWNLAPFEPRLKCIVANACLASCAAMIHEGVNHSPSNLIPGLYELGDVEHVIALIAPRALHFNLGGRDPGSPINYAAKALAAVKAQYEQHNAAHQFSAYIQQDAGHDLTPEMKTKVFEKFEAFL